MHASVLADFCRVDRVAQGRCPDSSVTSSRSAGFQVGHRRRGFDEMEAALGLAEARPAARSRVLAGSDSARAVGATDARVALIVQRVVGHIVLVNVPPHLFGIPVDDGVNFYQAELGIPLDLVCGSSAGSLIAANA
jgi:hypothetical protein